MPSRMIGPFQSLGYLKDAVIDPDNTLDCLEIMDNINSALAEQGCNCNGHNVGSHRDEYWGADLSDLVTRAAPHDVYGLDSTGLQVTETVRVRLDTLRVQVDSNNEVISWIYEHS